MKRGQTRSVLVKWWCEPDVFEESQKEGGIHSLFPCKICRAVNPLCLVPRLYEGAEGNLPDSASELASREVLSVARSCGGDDILVALVSGGGSALLSCPVPGISVEEKRKVGREKLSQGAV